jgi:outer membrane protein assembly factor BamB
VTPAPDLDGDGTGEFVFASRGSPSLLVISGKDGTVLWWHRGRPRPPATPIGTGAAPVPEKSEPLPRGWNHGTTLGRPLVVRVDGDDVSDFVTCFSSMGEMRTYPNNGFAISGQQSWVAAVSGKTGATLWRHPLSHGWLRPAHMQSSTSSDARYDLTCRPQVVTVGGRAVVAMLAGRTLLALDLATGSAVLPPHVLPTEPHQAPHFADIDADGTPGAILAEPGAVITAVSMQSGKPLWQHSLSGMTPGTPLPNGRDERAIVFHDIDFDGDGHPEVIAPAGNWDGQSWNSSQTYWTGLDMLDGATGKLRWRYRIDLGKGAPSNVDRLVPGPDLDGDGRAELFVTAMRRNPQQVLVTALGGADGRAIWEWRHAVSDAQPDGVAGDPLQWWRAGVDGRPQLLVPILRGPGGQSVTFVLTASTGRLAHVLTDAANPRVADFDGDAMPDLAYTVAGRAPPDRHPRHGAGALAPTRRVAPGSRPRPRRLRRPRPRRRPTARRALRRRRRTPLASCLHRAPRRRERFAPRRAADAARRPQRRRRPRLLRHGLYRAHRRRRHRPHHRLRRLRPHRRAPLGRRRLRRGRRLLLQRRRQRRRDQLPRDGLARPRR